MAAPIKFGVGQSVLRKEDDALIRGKGRYTDDHAPQPAMHALVLRSPHAHAPGGTRGSPAYVFRALGLQKVHRRGRRKAAGICNRMAVVWRPRSLAL